MEIRTLLDLFFVVFLIAMILLYKYRTRIQDSQQYKTFKKVVILTIVLLDSALLASIFKFSRDISTFNSRILSLTIFLAITFAIIILNIIIIAYIVYNVLLERNVDLKKIVEDIVIPPSLRIALVFSVWGLSISLTSIIVEIARIVFQYTNINYAILLGILLPIVLGIYEIFSFAIDVTRALKL